MRVKACALNFFDTLIIKGKYQYKPEMPFSPSAEFAGVVDQVGSGVEGVSPGDRVMGYMRWGRRGKKWWSQQAILSRCRTIFPLKSRQV